MIWPVANEKSRSIGPTGCALLTATWLLAGCAQNPPRVYGWPGTSPSPDVPWAPPARAVARAASAAPRASSVPPALRDSIRSWTLLDVVDVALRNSPETRAAWAEAHAQAAVYGSRRGTNYPELDANAGWTQQQGAAGGGKVTFKSRSYSPGLTLDWLIFDFGRRGASIDEARQALFAADWTHNAAIQRVILAVEQAYYQYVSAKALQDAASSAVKEEQTSLDAADDRHRAGVATVADVLQAKTAVSRAQLDLETLQGKTATTRGLLATSMGLPASTDFDVQLPPLELPLEQAEATVEHDLEMASTSRPDLAASRADALAAEAHVRTVRAAGYPALTAAGSLGRTYYENPYHAQDTYSAALQVRVPLFTGFSHHYDLRQAEAEAEVARAHLQSVEQSVDLEVWTSYYDLETAKQRVRTSEDLEKSATESHDVALGRYRTGVGTILDLLSAQSALESARAQQVQARSDWLLSVAQLAHAMGTLESKNQNPGGGQR